MKKYIYLLVIMSLLLMLNACSYINSNSKNIVKDSEYSTDLERIENVFPYVDHIEKCYWATGKIGNDSRLSVGPNDYWFKGYIILDSEIGDKILSLFDWIDVNDFDENGNPTTPSWHHIGKMTSPKVTGLSDFDWVQSPDFSEFVKAENFMGEYYFDKNNKIIYFDLSTY